MRVLEACVPHLNPAGFTVVNMSSGLGSISRVMGEGFNTLSQDIVYRSSKAALNMCTACSVGLLYKSNAVDP
jgi:NAD(P)-dependent dehydrogenase (short-subunit alcohol dehydrogenase family)